MTHSHHGGGCVVVAIVSSLQLLLLCSRCYGCVEIVVATIVVILRLLWPLLWSWSHCIVMAIIVI